MNAPVEAAEPDQPLRGISARRYIEQHHRYRWEDMLAFPKHVDIDTVNTCNARCTMCGIDFDRRPRQRMSEGLFDKIVAELAERREHLERVGLVVNSEPLMDRKLAQKVRKLKMAGIKHTSIITNAALLSRRRAEELLLAGLDTTYISIDSLDPATYERIRQGLSFETVYRNTCEFIQLKREINPNGVIRISMVQLRENRSEAQAFVDHWAELLGPNDQIVVTGGYNWGIAQDVVARHGGLDDENNRVPCVGLWTSFVIDVDGKVRMCCADQDGKTLLGDVRRESIADIWAGAEFARIRDLHLEGRRLEISMCDGCPIWSPTKHIFKHMVGASRDGRYEGGPLAPGTTLTPSLKSMLNS